MTLRERILSRLDQMQKTCDAATPGPWEPSGVPYNGLDDPCVLSASGLYIAQTVYDMQSGTQDHAVNEDTLFICESRSAMPLLIAALREEVNGHVLLTSSRGDAPDGLRCDGCDQWGEVDMVTCDSLRRIAANLGLGDVEKEG